MANTLKDSKINIINGLGAWTHTCGATNLYSGSIRCTMIPASSVILTIAQTGSVSVSVSSSAPASPQQIINLQKVFNCVAGDVITFTIASSAAIDKALNGVESSIILHQGSV